MAPETRRFFCHFGGVFLCVCESAYVAFLPMLIMQCQTLSLTSSFFFLITRPSGQKKGGVGYHSHGIWKNKVARNCKFLPRLISLPSLRHALLSKRKIPRELLVNRQLQNRDVDFVVTPENSFQRPDARSKQLHVGSTGLKIKFSKWFATERFGPSTPLVSPSGFLDFSF